MAGKYALLTKTLNALESGCETITLSFKELQLILGFSLPRSAHDHRPWWANQKNHESRSQAQGWMGAGFHVEFVDLQNKWVTFSRAKLEGAPSIAAHNPSSEIPAVKTKSAPIEPYSIFPAEAVASHNDTDNKRIVLISCAAKKLPHKAKAQDIYVSPLFQRQMAYARKLAPNSIFILSAKYGLLDLDNEIEPYDQTLKAMGLREQRAWAERILSQLKKKTNLSSDRFIVLAGNIYRRYITPALSHWEAPLNGLTIGRQLQKLNQLLHCSESDTCARLHQVLFGLPRFRFPFDEKRIPKNGLYVLYETGELGHGVDRIVRVGTHTGINQLRSRLYQHFILENKDRSIFRKNIGRALLNRNDDPFIRQWELDLTTRAAKDQYAMAIDFSKLHVIEKCVTEYIHERLSFVVIPVSDKDQRLRLESRLLSTVSLCGDCGPSHDWLGNQSPTEKIRRSGLWNVNELFKTPLSDGDFQQLQTPV